MSSTITVTIRVEGDAQVEVVREEAPPSVLPQEEAAENSAAPEDVEQYWHWFLSDNGRRFYAAAAALQRERDFGFTLDDVAERMGVEPESARSFHRTTGRPASRWRFAHRSDAPIRLLNGPYDWNQTKGGWRTTYGMSPKVAELIAELAATM